MPNSNVNRKVVLPNVDATIVYSDEAQALFDAVPTIPEVVKPFYEDVIIAFVDSGAWADSGFRCIMCVPSDNHDEYFIEIKSLALVPEMKISTPIVDPFDTANNRASSKGYHFNGNYYIDTGWIPNDLQTIGSHGHIFVTYQTSAQSTTYSGGVFQSPNSTLFSPKFSGTLALMDSMNLTVSQGRLQKTSATGEAGVYFLNRRATNDAEFWINNIDEDTHTTTGGAAPTISSYINTYNNGGSPGTRWNKSPICCYAFLGAGISTVNAQALNTALATWQTNMEYIDTVQDKVLLMDGNSHLTMQWSKQLRTLEIGYIVSGWDFQNFGVSGQTTPQMEADAAAQIDPFYDAGNIQNFLIAFEATNDFHINGYANVESNYETYCTNRQSAGWTVTACHMMTRNNSGNTDSLSQEAYDLRTDEFNTWLDANYTDFADALATAPVETFVYRSDYASDGDYATAMAALRADTTYYDTDTLHLTEAGYALWFPKYQTIIDAL